MVEVDRVEELLGDLLGAGEDRVECGAANEVGQAAGHAGGAVVQVVGELEQASGFVAVQP
ncbi:hypothetical protein [Paractinoplanes brasiliensis]|uniref:hypothetical protein n=1 Tax=Paractinoplanes brasiliensis TaxID=52695 RepID=UPI00141500D4|nr:hypothetical protein [Actinoplanes brasiliensis]